MGGRSSSGSRNTTSEYKFTPDDWEDWSEDPSVYQQLERGIDISEDLEDRWEPEEFVENYERMVQLAKEMQQQALSKTVGQATLYRGESYNSLAQAMRKYEKGKTFTNTQLTSYSTTKDLAEHYATQTGRNVSVIIVNKNTAGNSVGLRANHYGEKPGQDREIITARGMQSTVTRTQYDEKNNILYVYASNSMKPKRK